MKKKCGIFIVFAIVLIMIVSCQDGDASEGLDNDINDGNTIESIIPKYEDFDDMPSNYSLSSAKEDGCVVFENSTITSGKEIWNEFVSRSNEGESVRVRTAYYYSDNSELYLLDVSYDGEIFYIHEAESGVKREYKYLNYYISEVENNSQIEFCEYYILLDDKYATLEEIKWGMVSSQLNDGVYHYSVYTDFNYVE